MIDRVTVYNFAAGVINVFVTAFLIWMNHSWAFPMAVATLVAHSLVMVILQTIYRDVVAVDSIVAMTLRLIVWLMILTLLYIQKRKTFVLG